MSVMYNQINCDERFSSILEPNLYYGSIFVPGVTCTDKYQIGPAGGIYVRKLATTPCSVGVPGRDFTDEAAKDELLQIVLNNNYQKSKKIYGVQSAAVSVPLANENLSIAIKEVGEARQISAVACLLQEGKASTIMTAITPATVKHDILAVRKELVKSKGNANIVLCHPDFYANVLETSGTAFTPVANDRIAASGNVGQWLGFTFIETPLLAEANGKYYDHTGTLKTVNFANIDFVMYNSETLSIIPNFEAARLKDAENFVGTKAQVEVNCGFRVTNDALVILRKHTAI